jgi:dihydroxyacetone kinase-like protein
VALSEIDGAIDDGEHGVSIAKGFYLCAERLVGRSYDLATGLTTLGTVLLSEIGGAMGPLNGTFFFGRWPSRRRVRTSWTP